jgi:hypothetical protein
MSYCRNNGKDSDVYVIGTRDGLECFCEDHLVLISRAGMIAHLRDHQRQGDKVPERAFERLYREIDEGYDREKYWEKDYSVEKGHSAET